MTKLSKAEIKLHHQAEALLEQDVLSDDDRAFVFEHWRADADHEVQSKGAYFTPLGLAQTFALECNGAQSVLDLCAGIGALSYGRWQRDRPRRMVCVERNPSYVAVGKKLLPEAEWVVADVFALPDLGHFDLVISNPPFGKVPLTGQGPRYRGRVFEYHLIDLASQWADQGVFLIPQPSAGFRPEDGTRRESREFARFTRETGLVVTPGLGIDPSVWIHDWHGVAPNVASVRVDFCED